MNPLAIAQLIAQLLPYGVKFVSSIITLVHTQNPTEADWQKALMIAQTPFDEGLEPGALIPDKPKPPTEGPTPS
jgi:hypothetical protein